MGKTAARETHIAIFQLHVDFRLVEDGIGAAEWTRAQER